ncbi:TBC1 domain family member 5-like isoform X2 [Amphiura filiformis]|uniref:TBC1 domain family member 5-like isoform X2 n=1 Tax=Amphiura filiformis TaxID=82378 RepID=UPI003B21356E
MYTNNMGRSASDGRLVMQQSRDDTIEVTDPLTAASASLESLEENEGSFSSSTSTSYRDEWVRLFERKDYVAAIKLEGIRGGLRSSRFRSVCWRVYLECLSEEQAQWEADVKKSRQQYSDIKQEHISNSLREDNQEEVDLALFNPLSQEEDSPWNKYFQDKETKQMITQDVIRTFPEIPFFQTSDVREMLVNLLFCYCKEHEDLGYKQGMHELLAPLIFVLHCDHQAFLHAQEISSQLIESSRASCVQFDVMDEIQREMVKIVLDPDFMEHDAYTMFTHLMETMDPWYQHGRDHRAYKKKHHLLRAEPFSRPPDYSPTSPLVKKINRIQEIILKNQDTELYLHLSRLEIQPQVFGIRWIRLLYGREFTLMDLLVLWDAIFADSFSLVLVDYIYVAMLMLVRELLIAADYTHCMELLMRFPMVGDVRFIIEKSLHLRDPKKYARPANYQFQILQQTHAGRIKTVHHVAPQGARSGSKQPTGMTINNTFKQKTSAVVTSGFNSLKRITTKTKASDRGPGRAKTTDNLPHPLAQTTDLVSEVARKPLKSTKPGGETSIEFYSPGESSALVAGPNGIPKKDSTKPKGQGKKAEPMEVSAEMWYRSRYKEEDPYQQVALLQGKLNDVQNMCQYCSTKMEAHVIQIQDELNRLKLADEDELLIAIAGLKQVKDVLKGTLKFACGLEEEEIIISDNHFQEEEELRAAKASSVKHCDQSQETFLDNDPVLTSAVGSLNTNQHQSHSAVSSNGDDESEKLLTFDSHFNECNNVDRTAVLESGKQQNGHAQTGVGEQNGRTPSDIDNDNSETAD